MHSDDILDALNDSDFNDDSGNEYIPTSSDEFSDSSDTDDVDLSTNTLVSNTPIFSCESRFLLVL